MYGQTKTKEEIYQIRKGEAQAARAAQAIRLFNSILSPEEYEPCPFPTGWGCKIKTATQPLVQATTWRRRKLFGQTSGTNSGTIGRINNDPERVLSCTSPIIPAIAPSFVARQNIRRGTIGTRMMSPSMDIQSIKTNKSWNLNVGTVDKIQYWPMILESTTHNFSVSNQSKAPVRVAPFIVKNDGTFVTYTPTLIPAGVATVGSSLAVPPGAPGTYVGFGLAVEANGSNNFITFTWNTAGGDTYEDCPETLINFPVTFIDEVADRDQIIAIMCYAQSLYLKSTAPQINDGGNLASCVLPPFIDPGQLVPGIDGITSRPYNAYFGKFGNSTRVSTIPNRLGTILTPDTSFNSNETGYVFAEVPSLPVDAPPGSWIVHSQFNYTTANVLLAAGATPPPAIEDVDIVFMVLVEIHRATENEGHRKYFEEMKKLFSRIAMSPELEDLVRVASPRGASLLGLAKELAASAGLVKR